MSTAPTAATPDPKPTTVYEKGKVNPQTEYVVLEDKDGEVWKVGPNVSARSAEEAVRVGSNGQAGTYLAVPARSWKPVKVTVETVSRVKLEDA